MEELELTNKRLNSHLSKQVSTLKEQEEQIFRLKENLKAVQESIVNTKREVRKL
jgi:uncharacterized coiled-coil protein SlyX